jgi:uncharacterized protein (DUF58 family)
MRSIFKPCFRPTRRLLWLIVGLATLGLIIGVGRVFDGLPDTPPVFWQIVVGLTLVAAAYDYLTGKSVRTLRGWRIVPHSFALNTPQSVVFKIANDTGRALNLSLTEGLPKQLRSSAFPLHQTVKPEQVAYFEYFALPVERGIAGFTQAYVLADSRLGLWQFVLRLGEAEEVKVYPDFSAVSNSFVFGVEQAMRNMGAHIALAKGSGMEFNQLREFRAGDTLKQIDWKATARVGEPISREYQEEKDQNIVFLLDCSRRMRARENKLSYFDYALNALLMSSYIALDKGDAVGVMTFSGEPTWLPPIKGKSSVNRLLNHLFALKTSTQSSDYVEAAEQLLTQQRKRSLIIIITNVREEDANDLGAAVKLLSEQHLVMVVALQEAVLSQVDSMTLSSHEDLMLFAGVKHFARARKKLLALLKGRGVSVVDATHKNIQVQLVTEYLSLKKHGRI